MAKEAAATAEAKSATTTTAADEGFLDQIIKATKPRTDTQMESAKKSLSEFVGKLLEPGAVVSKDVEKTINFWIAEIDKKISAQLNEIMHTPDFQKLEGSWRGLNHLVMNSETGTMLKLRLLNATKDEIQKDLERAIEFDQSAQFKKIYEEEYGTFGGSPYSVLIGDYEFGRSPQDIKWLEKMSNVAAAAHAPFMSPPLTSMSLPPTATPSQVRRSHFRVQSV